MSPEQIPGSGPKQTIARLASRLRKSHSRVIIGLLILALVLVGVLVGYLIFGRGSAPAEMAAGAAAPGQKKPTTWHCSMHPQITSAKPGKCGICFMDLIPMPEDVGGYLGPRQLRMSPEAVALAKIQTTPVKRQTVAKEVRMTGKVGYDEAKVIDIAAWVPGRLDRLYVDYTGITVRKGDHLVYMYSPELVVAQRELIQGWQAYNRPGGQRDKQMALATLKSTEEKLRLLGLLDEQIEEIKRSGKPSDHLTIYAPVGGIVIRKHANEGMYVKTGMIIYTIADLSRVWVYLDAYESDIAWLREGQEVEFTTISYPGEIFKGRIAFIDPVLTGKSRAIKVRVNAPNTDLRLKPGMFVQAIVRSHLAVGGRVLDSSLAGKWICPMHNEIVKDVPGICDICEMPLEPAEKVGVVAADKPLELPLVIPITAPLRTGKRAVVYLQIDPLPLRPQEVFDWPGLVSKILEQAKAAEPSGGKWIWERLAPGLKKKLKELPSPPVLEPLLKFELLDALNGLLARRDFDDGVSWQQVKEAGKVAALPADLAGKLSADDIMLRNRRLLASALVGPPDPATGRRPPYIAAVVPNPTFEGREIVLGPRVGEYYIVRHGLAENEMVVTRGAFKLDADLQIKAKPSMMNPESLDSTKKKLEISTDFRVGLDPVYQAYLRAAKALADDDVPKARQQIKRLLAAVDGVNSRLLDDEARKYWQYYKNHILFAAYDTLDGRDTADTRQSFGGLSQAMVHLVQGFGHALPEPMYQFRCATALDHQGADWLQLGREIANPYLGSAKPRCGEQIASFKSQAPLDVPDALRRQLGKVYGPYLQLQEALADDRLPDAVAAWGAIRSALDTIDTQGLGAREEQAWQETRQRLAQDLDAERRGAEIDEVRKRFEALSTTMLDMVEAFGHVRDGPLSKAFCPMAFGNKGAAWLQAGSKIANPYFGHKMLRCGDVKRTFPAAAGTPAKNNPAREELK